MVKSVHLASSKLGSCFRNSWSAKQPSSQGKSSVFFPLMHIASVAPMRGTPAINVRLELSDMTTVARGQVRSVTTRYVSTGTGGKRKTQATKLSYFTIHRNPLRAHRFMHAELLGTKVSHPRPRHHRLQTTTTHRLQLALSQQEEDRFPSPDRNRKSTTLLLRSALSSRSPEHLSLLTL